jgi:hypothetical protein
MRFGNLPLIRSPQSVPFNPCLSNPSLSIPCLSIPCLSIPCLSTQRSGAFDPVLPIQCTSAQKNADEGGTGTPGAPELK